MEKIEGRPKTEVGSAKHNQKLRTHNPEPQTQIVQKRHALSLTPNSQLTTQNSPFMKKIPLHWKIVIGLFLGVAWAVAGSYLGWSTFTESWIAPFGRIFINLLKLIAVPLILFSIIGGIVSLGHPRNLGRLGGKTLLIYLVTTLFSVSLGLLLVNVFKPGKALDDELRLENRMAYELWLTDKGLSPRYGRLFSHDPEN